jgi:hypothetical protein
MSGDLTGIMAHNRLSAFAQDWNSENQGLSKFIFAGINIVSATGLLE